MSPYKLDKQHFLGGVVAAVLSVSLALPVTVHAQGALDEIVVTAQRREQTLRDVPISIEVVSGDMVQEQGYRDLESMALFSPSVNIDASGFLSQEIRIRGFGTSGNTLTLEQAAPTFLDGIHFGRPGQIRNAFMDVQRVEVLKGPQPVYFGLNATAGAFNITSRGPTPEWEGYLDTEFANHNSAQADFGIGGPINETWGIRVAGRYEKADGYVTDIFSGDEKGDFENIGGRLILKWTPNDRFNAAFKVEITDVDKDPEATVLCRTDGPLIFDGRSFNGTNAPGRGIGDERSIYAEPPEGSGSPAPFEPLTRDCFQNDSGASRSGPFIQLPLNVREENSNRGNIDIRNAVDYWFRNASSIIGTPDVGTPDGLPGFGYETLEATNGYLDLNYTFGNGLELTSKTGFSYFERETMRDNSDTPFLLNVQNRGEDFEQISVELRLTGKTDGYDIGGMNANFEIGAFFQQTDNVIFSNGPRANVRRGLRFIDIIEDQKWQSVFANFTLNFAENITLEIGGRFTDLDKFGDAKGWGANWVFDVFPCEATNLDEFDPATCTQEDNPFVFPITADETLFLLPGADTSNLWRTGFRRTRDTPTSWYSGRAQAVGLSEQDFERIAGPCSQDFPEEQFDPQLSLRWRANENVTVYFRYAEAFKAGGFDTGVSEINPSCDDFSFDSEFSENMELGAKGVFWDGRGRFDVTLFDLTFNGLQVSSATNDPDNPFVNINAGEQRTRGLEFTTSAAINDNLTVGLSGAFYDGEMVFFPNAGCTDAEFFAAPGSGCDPDTGLIDRSGTPAPDIPDWKIVANLEYEVPVRNEFKFNLSLQGFISDSILTDNDGFDPTVSLDQHEDLNVLVGFGDINDVWRVSVFGRNLLEVRPTYHPEFDIFPNGLAAASLSASAFTSYGVKFRYNWE